MRGRHDQTLQYEDPHEGRLETLERGKVGMYVRTYRVQLHSHRQRPQFISFDVIRRYLMWRGST